MRNNSKIKMLTRPKIFFLTLFLHAVSFCMGEKVLFIGNSYTAQCSKTISGLFKSESPDWSLSFHTSGGKDLAFHLADSQVTKKINSQKWDFIVLQEQSQKSGLGGKFSKSFHESVASFSKIIRKAGAIPSSILHGEEKMEIKDIPKFIQAMRLCKKRFLLPIFWQERKTMHAFYRLVLPTPKSKKESRTLRKTLQK